MRISDWSSDVCSSDLSSFQRKLESHAAGEALAEKDPSLRWGDDERSYHPAPQVGIGGLESEIGAHGRPQGTDAVLDMRGARPFGGRPGIDDDGAVDAGCAFPGRGERTQSEERVVGKDGGRKGR